MTRAWYDTTTTIDRENSIVWINRLSGSLSLDELDEIISRIERDERVGVGFHVLFEVDPEVTAMPTMEILRERLNALVRLRNRLGSFRLAVVVLRDAHYGLANAAIVQAGGLEGIEVRAFRSREQAVDWLGEASRR